MSNTKLATELAPVFVEQSGMNPAPPNLWPGMIIRRASIEREIERLADLPPPGNGRRASAVTHPNHTGPGNGLTRGIDVVINVLKPGESTAPIRRNSNQVELCIGGAGVAEVNGDDLPLCKWDVCNIPAMQRYRHRNTSNDLFVRLTYSNAPLLEKLGVHYFEEDPPVRRMADPRPVKLKEGAFDVELPGGARLQSYEYLADIQIVKSRAHRWAWKDIKERLAFAPHTGNREVVLLYNPATGPRAGTSTSFFANVIGGTTTAPLQPQRWGHRHTSAAINYWLMGTAVADVEGEKMTWNPGDLILTASGWERHAIYWGSSDGSPMDWGSVTVQDHPMHIALESLVWTDGPNKPVKALGLEEAAEYLGFTGSKAAAG